MKLALGEKAIFTPVYSIDLRLWSSVGEFLKGAYFGYWSQMAVGKRAIHRVFIERAVG